MGLFTKQVTCPKCGTVYTASKFAYSPCPKCKGGGVVPIPDYDLVGPTIVVPGPGSAEGLISAGLIFPGAQVCLSERHPALMAMATRHAKYQASMKQQGHQLFAARCEELRQSMGPHEFAEIAAESWPWQKTETMFNLGDEMFKCWRQSPGHWSVACKKHRYFGADMAMGTNGIWYAAIITAD
jgi:hypothetical protein